MHTYTQHRNLQAPAPATFGVKKVVPVDEVKGGGGKDGDKGLLKVGTDGCVCVCAWVCVSVCVCDVCVPRTYTHQM